MPSSTIVLLHSPLVGPMTWRPVAARLSEAGRRVVVPDLSAALRDGPPHQPALAEAVRAAVADGRPATRSSLLLVGHSGAGPLLPGLATALGDRVTALIYVDAQLPYPGRSWWQSAPPPLVKHLSELIRDGMVPPWHEWFPPGAVAALLPDPAMLAAFTGELGPVPLSFFTEPTAPAEWPGPAGYLLLSEGYREDADAARSAGLTVAELDTHHLAMLTDPGLVAERLSHLDLSQPDGPGR